jgi:ureidoacrylate peracid hydrolase
MASLLTTLEEQVRPEHAALLIIDMQNDFCATGGYLQRERNYDVSRTVGIADRIGIAVNAARDAGMAVVWIRSIYDFKYLTEADIAKRQKEGCCLEGTWGADFFKLAPAAGEIIVDKHCFSGFNKTSLDAQLRGRGIRTLIVTGVATNVCVDSTLRDGFFRGYYIVLLEDCVGSNSSTGHDGTLATVRNNIGTVVSSTTMIDSLKHGQGNDRVPAR